MRHQHQFIREAQPMHLDAFSCPDCKRDAWACECNDLPAYQGSDLSLYRQEKKR